jgi:hypothetical protein
MLEMTGILSSRVARGRESRSPNMSSDLELMFFILKGEGYRERSMTFSFRTNMNEVSEETLNAKCVYSSIAFECPDFACGPWAWRLFGGQVNR